MLQVSVYSPSALEIIVILGSWELLQFCASKYKFAVFNIDDSPLYRSAVALFFGVFHDEKLPVFIADEVTVG